MTSPELEKPIDVAIRHLIKVQQAVVAPVDWTDLSTYAFYALEAAVVAASPTWGSRFDTPTPTKPEPPKLSPRRTGFRMFPSACRNSTLRERRPHMATLLFRSLTLRMWLLRSRRSCAQWKISLVQCRRKPTKNDICAALGLTPTDQPMA